VRVIRNTTQTMILALGTDEVCAACPVPAGGKLLSVQGEVHVIGLEAAPTTQFAAFGFSGELIEITDPDTAVTMDVLWDQHVTKTVDPTETAGISTVDFDWDTVDTSPDVEPGEVDANDMTGLFERTKEIFAPQIEWMSFAKGQPVAVAAASPDTYTPRAFKTFRSQKTLMADTPSYALLALSSPALDQHENEAARVTLGNAQRWAILENLRNVMNDFWRINTGMVEAGAESPYAVISSAIGDLVSPLMIDPDTTLLDPMSYTALCRATWVLDLPGSSIPSTLAANNE